MPQRFYNTTAAERRQHSRDHQAGLINRESHNRACYCSVCYPNPPTVSNQFTTFWTWISREHGANKSNGYTKSAFESFSTLITTPDTTLTDLAQLTIFLLQSIRFTNLDTPIVELSFYFHRLFIATNGYRNPVTTQLLNQARRRYLFPSPTSVSNPTSPVYTPTSSPVNTPPRVNTPPLVTPPPVNPNPLITMATGAEMTALFNGIFGATGENVRPEGNVLKVEPFYGKKTEDPVTWLAAFNRAITTNQWKDNRRVAIASGYLRGEAAEWFEGKKADIGVHWAIGENGEDNFTRQFELRFLTEQRRND